VVLCCIVVLVVLQEKGQTQQENRDPSAPSQLKQAPNLNSAHPGPGTTATLRDPTTTPAAQHSATATLSPISCVQNTFADNFKRFESSSLALCEAEDARARSAVIQLAAIVRVGALGRKVSSRRMA
jgi:hypothetical protein